MTRFAFQPIIDKIREKVLADGLTAVCVELDLPLGVVRSANDGRNISANSLALLADRLGYEFYIGPSRHPDAPLQTKAQISVAQLGRAIQIANDGLRRARRKLSPEKHAQLISEIYAYLDRDKPEDSETFDQLIRMAS